MGLTLKVKENLRVTNKARRDNLGRRQVRLTTAGLRKT
jgi:hypothetical protein